MAGYTRYGWYRFGRNEFRPGRSGRGSRYEDKGPSDEELFGAGVALKTFEEEGVPWDFVADSTGDLGATKGLDELGKDTAFKAGREGGGLIGSLATPNDMARAESGIEQLMFTDSRVTGIDAEVQQDPDYHDRVSVGMEVTAEGERLPTHVFPMEW